MQRFLVVWDEVNTERDENEGGRQEELHGEKGKKQRERCKEM